MMIRKIHVKSEISDPNLRKRCPNCHSDFKLGMFKPRVCPACGKPFDLSGRTKLFHSIGMIVFMALCLLISRNISASAESAQESLIWTAVWGLGLIILYFVYYQVIERCITTYVTKELD